MTGSEFIEWALKQDTDECILWPLSVNSSGHGRVAHGGKHVTASRRVLQRATGLLGTGLDASHACKSKSCVNPRHLSWKTRRGNVADMVRDGTKPQGSRHGSAFLTEADVTAIRAACAPVAELATRYSVSKSTIYKIKQGRTWRHV